MRIDKRRIGSPRRRTSTKTTKRAAAPATRRHTREASSAFIPGNTVDSEYGHERLDEPSENRKASIHHPVGERLVIPRHPLCAKKGRFCREVQCPAVLAKDQVPTRSPDGACLVSVAWVDRGRDRETPARHLLGTTETPGSKGGIRPRSAFCEVFRISRR